MVSFIMPRVPGGLTVPPDGVTPDYTNPPNRNIEIYVVSGFCISIVIVLVSLRTYTRFAIIKKQGWQDYLILLALPLALFFMFKTLLGTRYGLGVHQWNVTGQHLVKFAQAGNFIMISYSSTVCLIKLAILIQLAHIFTPSKGRTYWIICMISAFTVMFYVACIISRIFQCIPREKIWNPFKPGKCINSPAELVSSAVVNALSDLILLIIPLSMISRLHMSRRKKWAVSAVFSTGLFCFISSVMRLVISVDLLKPGDETYRFLTAAFWAEAEITSGIACFCLPVLPQFYRTHVSGFVTFLHSRLQSYTASTVIGPDSLSGDFQSTGQPQNMAGEWIPRTKHTSVDLERPLVGNDDVTARGGGRKVFVKTENTTAGNGVWDEDVEMGRIKATSTVQIETHII